MILIREKVIATVEVIKKTNFAQRVSHFLKMESISPSPSEDQTALDRTLRETSRNISGVYLVSCVYGLVVFIVLSFVFALSSSSVLSWDRRIILGAIVGVFLLSSVSLLFLSRKEGKLLVILCPVVTHITGFALGLCTWYL